MLSHLKMPAGYFIKVGLQTCTREPPLLSLMVYVDVKKHLRRRNSSVGKASD